MKEKNQEPNMIVYATQYYTALEKDVVSIVVNNLDTGFNIQPDLWQNKLVTVTAKMLNIDARKYHHLKKVAETLVTKVIKYVDDEKEEFDFIVPFPRVKYNKGTLAITMFADVIPHFLELKNGYTEYYLKESLSLHGVRTKRLYELFSSKKKYLQPTLKLYDDELKKLLNIKPSAYKGRPQEIEDKQIIPNVDEINEKTSLDVKYQRDKDSVGWFTEFKIKERKADKEPEANPRVMDEKSKRCYEKLKELGVVRSDLVELIVNEHQDKFWAWIGLNKTNLEEGNFKSPSGVLLVHLGLFESKKPNKGVAKPKLNEKPKPEIKESDFIEYFEGLAELRKKYPYSNDTNEILRAERSKHGSLVPWFTGQRAIGKVAIANGLYYTIEKKYLQ